MPVVFIFIGLLAAFVILPLIGVLVWFMISTAITGILLGALARTILPGKQPIGVIATIVSGWIGSLIGGAIGAAAFGYHHDRFFTLLIEIGVSAVAVLAWSAGNRRGQLTGNQHHRVIDI
jgi:uncharacterized membrane protein YeaQ/YmgE (transglycosylase-associated protein family)